MSFAVISAVDQAAWASKSLVDSTIAERNDTIILNNDIGASVSVAGFEDAQQLGDVRKVINRGEHDVILLAEDTNAPANNRFATTEILAPDSQVTLFFNGLRWESYTARPTFLTSALEFDGTQQHVNHGYLWHAGVAYTNFYSEILVKPLGDGLGYIISAGYGGAHCQLIGLTGTPANGYTITGNVYDSDTATLTSFFSMDGLRYNEWAHMAVVYDGTNIITRINGIPCQAIARIGQRKTANAFDGGLFIGGSDHNNFTGRIGAVRIYENTIPSLAPNTFSNLVFRPDIHRISMSSDTPEGVSPAFVADYRTGRLDDQSIGLAGIKHNGFLAEASQFGQEWGAFYNNGAYNLNSSLRPKWVVDPFVWPTTSAPQKTQIPGTRIYEDFSRADIHLGNVAALLELGTTRIGGRVWSGTGHGILNGNAYTSSVATPAIIMDTASDGTIIWRRPWVTSTTLGGYNFQFRYTDGGNTELLEVYTSGLASLLEYSGGIYQGAPGGGFDVGTTWLEIKVVLNGTTCQVYVDGALNATRTMGFNAGAGGKGFLLGPTIRLSEFGVI